MQKGMVWRIGDGKIVSLNEDKWLSDQVYRPVSSPLFLLMQRLVF